MKIKLTARGYEATVTIPVFNGIPQDAPNDDGSGEVPVGWDAVGKQAVVWDKTSGAWNSTLTSVTSANNTALSALDASGIQEGRSVYVQTYKETFYLTKSGQSTAVNERVAALNKPGYLWLRGRNSKAWWSQDNWYWDPANITGLASDENDGATATTPLLTNDEYYRRHDGRFIPGIEVQNVTVNLMSDCGDKDFFCANMQMRSMAPGTMTLQGTVTVVPVGLLAASVDLNTATNVGNQITVTGFDFSPYVGQILRLTGTSGGTSVVASIEQSLSLGSCRVCEMWDGVSANTAGNFETGQTVEILSLPKTPGVHVTNADVNIVECKIDRGDGSSINLGASGNRNAITLTRCEMRGALQNTGIQNQVFCQQFSLNGGSIVGSTWIFNNCSFNTLGSAMVNAFIYVGVAPLRHHPAGFGGTNSTMYVYDGASMRLHGNFHMFGLPVNGVGVILRYGAVVYSAAAYYGSGNNANSAGIQMLGSTRYHAQGGIPTMDAGLAIYFDSNDGRTVTDPANTGFSVAWSALAARSGVLTARLGAYVTG